jgi:hypothetical protein
MRAFFPRLAIGLLLGGLVACSSSSSSNAPPPGDPQNPPTTGGADVEAWLRGGAYKAWHCEAAAHVARGPSIHGVDRVCTNAVANAATSNTTAPWPKGTAAVKELFNATSDTSPGGYAVYVKTAADSAGGASWYYYERGTDGHVYADGFGSGGDAKNICVGCHVLAGTDAAHTTTPGGHDFVYTSVP